MSNNVPIIGEKKTLPRPKIMVGIPYYRDISPKTMGALLQLMGEFPAEWSNMWHATANVAQGRNVIADAFLESDAEYLFWLDSDMVFHPSQFMMLFMALRDDPKAGLIGGMYTKRDASLTPLIGLMEDGKPQPVDEHVAWLVENRGQVVEANLIPTGFMLIRKEVFAKLKRPFYYRDWPWKDDPNADEEFRDKMWSSDNVFVRDTGLAGFKTLAHLGVEVGHIGEMVYHPEHFYQQAQSFTVAGQIERIKHEVGSQVGYDSPIYWDKLYTAEMQAGRVRQYTELHEAVRAAIVGKQKVIEFGSGPGVLAEKLREDGHDVTTTDFSQVAVEACKKLEFDAFQFDLQNDKVPTGKHKKYDVVVATEVLEHLEDVPAAIKRMYAFLKPGGLIIVSTPDNCLPPEEEPEHKHLVTEAGMRTWLLPFEQIEVLKVNTQPFPKLLGMAAKPEKK